MKLNKLCIAALLVAGTVGVSSCKEDFLNETQITQHDTEYFKTQEGIDALVTGAYQTLKFRYEYQWAYKMWHMGVDEFTGGNNDMADYNHYSSALNSTQGDLATVWNTYYGLIEQANIVIQNVPLYYSQSNSNYNIRLGEGYFLRAYGYFELVKLFGGVCLKLEPSTSVETYFTRDSEENCYKQIISDFEQAYSLLPTSSLQTGRILKTAAAHFLAKAHLFRASEANDSWNSSYKSSDLEAVIKYGKEVLAAHPLCTNFADLWNYTKPNDVNESVSEVVLAAQFSDNSDSWGRFGNQMHLCYPSVYQNLAGCVRDISGGREFCYVSATEYAMEVFDRVNDSRFWKSFITCYGCNKGSAAPKWDAADAAYYPEGAQTGAGRFKGGEIGIKYIVNNPEDTRYTAKDGNTSQLNVLKDGKLENTHTFVRYYANESFNWNVNKAERTGNYYILYPHNRSVAISKWRDGSRNGYNSQFGCRDAITARSAEDVLMIAEAYIRQGESQYANAITYLNMLRDRAGYASGEDRSKSVDGGQAYLNNPLGTGVANLDGAIYTDENTYYESNNIAVTTEETKSVMHLNSVDDVYNMPNEQRIYQALKCTSNAQKMMCFLLDERSRELIGEGHRFEDLVRTRTLDARWHAFNDGAGQGIGNFDPSKHYLRPIPQSFLDNITNENGQKLSDEEKAAMQNPGY